MRKNLKNNENKNLNNERLLFAAKNNNKRVLEKYKNSYKGYDLNQVSEMRETFGENKITTKNKDTILKKLFRSLINPFTVILLILATVSLITDVLIKEVGNKDYTAVIIVVSMVLFSGVINFIQELKSGIASEKLSEMVETTISVVRENIEELEIPIDEIVTGDIIKLAAGDMIPADVRILDSKDLFVSESSLTGESEPIEKTNKRDKSESNNPLEMKNLAFMGSNVISGSAFAIAINVGDNTMFGAMAQSLLEEKEETAFEKGINSVSWLLIKFMLVMVPIVLFINGYTKGDWMEAFLFAISVAVGLTPEMLPMVVSANLAKGATAMAKKKVIVKDLNSIQNLGSMDVLCTDKTGTLTQDKVVLEYSLDIEGNEDNRVLKYAFLNSYHQTGLKNLMDRAIIEHAHENEMLELWQNYKKVDEIPFDFNRRRMSVVVKNKNGKTQLITKGAIEEMLSVSTFVEYKNEVLEINDTLKELILNQAKEYNKKGFRVLGISKKNNPKDADIFSVKDESEMVLIGFLAFLDPPKESTKDAIKALSDYGVDVKVLTGDNEFVTMAVCKKVGIKTDKIILGNDVDSMDDNTLRREVEEINVFAKLSPNQKVRVVKALKENGHVVGFMGDGINDAAALKESDVGVSVDTAVDISKESADIILLEKDLMVLEDGLIEGRKIYANIIKYIKMTASSNFGNIFSVLIASIFLPFLPMLPIQILMLNLIYDISCIAMPWDNVDEDYIKIPRKWDSNSVSKFMIFMGPSSSIFDIITFLSLYFIICPLTLGGRYNTLSIEGQQSFMAIFNAGWFVVSLWTQTLVIHLIRTKKKPFFESRTSKPVTILTSLGIIIGTLIPYTFFGEALKMLPLPKIFYPALILIVLAYVILVTILKKLFIRKYKELL